MSTPDPTTQELRLETLQREVSARRAADETPDPNEEHTFSRRAERARYLQDKLAERERSEREG